ncbi:hypothetical protein [Wolbachia endosymbiont (group A) of Apoderus coryli]|uniref:hypothetical protein n=1 Tax=Wolbachia endosymbiont (group A) of Apoderus coryli TaxID=2953980 RepID=UPI002230286B|nr:hypothetical protein [Wolbachia endosymbiont (group A) of Apoderus coryli]
MNRHTAAVSLDPANKQRDDELLSCHAAANRHTVIYSRYLLAANKQRDDEVIVMPPRTVIPPRR